MGELLAVHNPAAWLTGRNEEVGLEQEEVEGNLYAALGRAEMAGDGPMARRGGAGRGLRRMRQRREGRVPAACRGQGGRAPQRRELGAA